MGCKKGAATVEGEELPLAAKKRAEIRGGRGAIGSCCELPKNGRGKGRGVAVAMCGELPENG